ncbi:hypothetical protein DRQ25_11365 [Candidatus Fermentibacteria bacterium]|nr:MAG: hypothetical protein DRQ25_11365 [Candidatus Fermentibacteria bacterium]
MKRVFLLICVLAFAGTAFAGFSIGFKQTPVPTYLSSALSLTTDDVYMLRLGAMASPDFRIEGYLGYGTQHAELDPAVLGVEYDGSVMVFGAGGYYIIAAPANTSFSIGAQFLYGKATGEYGTSWDHETSTWSLDPLMRIDFAIPGAERLAFFTEYGIRYANATTTYTEGTTVIDRVWSGWQTYSPPNILAGAYYIF